MATIVQNYGPIYGEVVNGTVQGRPNGSVYVPISNTVSLRCTGTITKFEADGNYSIRTVGGASDYYYAVAQSQDLSSVIVIQLYEDAELTTLVTENIWFSAGLFNISGNVIGPVDSDYVLVSEQTYYLVAKLMNNNVPVAVSEAVEVVAE